MIKQSILISFLMAFLSNMQAMENITSAVIKLPNEMKALSLVDTCVRTINQNSVTKKEEKDVVTPYGDVIMKALLTAPDELKEKIIAGTRDDAGKLNNSHGLHPAFVKLKQNELSAFVVDPNFPVDAKMLLLDKLPAETINRLASLIFDGSCPDIVRAELIGMSTQFIRNNAEQLKQYFYQESTPQIIKCALFLKINELQTSKNFLNLLISGPITEKVARKAAIMSSEDNIAYWLLSLEDQLDEHNKALLRDAFIQKLQIDLRKKVIVTPRIATDEEITWLYDHGVDLQPAAQGNRATLTNRTGTLQATITSRAQARASVNLARPDKTHGLRPMLSLSIPHDSYTRVTWNEDETRLILEAEQENGNRVYFTMGFHYRLITDQLDFRETLVYSEAFREAYALSTDLSDFKVCLRAYKTALLRKTS